MCHRYLPHTHHGRLYFVVSEHDLAVRPGSPVDSTAGGRFRWRRTAPPRPQFSSLSVSQIGIVSALGIATIAAPLTGLVSGPVAKEAANEIATAPVAAPAFPFLHTVQTAVGDLRVVTDDSIAPSIPSDLAPPRDLLVTRPARGQERAVLPGCFGQAPMIKAANGQLPNSSL